jgi:glutathione S-transferase
MKLLANSQSPFVRKVRITLYEKDLDFDSVEIRHGTQRAELLRANRRGEVPVLEDGAAVVAGSALICDYLEDKYPNPRLLPVDPVQRAQCKALERIADTYTDVLQFFLALVTARRPELNGRYPEVDATIRRAIERHYEFLD